MGRGRERERGERKGERKAKEKKGDRRTRKEIGKWGRECQEHRSGNRSHDVTGTQGVTGT